MPRENYERLPRERPKRLGKKLGQIRAKLGISQKEMLNRIGMKGHHGFVSMWERGHREPPLIALLRYARCAGVSTDVLLDDDLDLPFEEASTDHPAQEKSS